MVKPGNLEFLDPDKLFEKDADGNIKKIDKKAVLGEAGKFLKARLDKVFEENSGVRIDHMIGWLRPFVYRENKIAQGEELKGERLKVPEEIITEILFRSAEEHGIDKNNILCEDLGAYLPEVNAILKKHDLPTMAVGQYVYPPSPIENDAHRLPRIGVNKWHVPGTHDNRPLEKWAQDLYVKEPELAQKHIKQLIDDLSLKENDLEEAKQVVKATNTSGNRRKFINEIVKLKLAEVFASKARIVDIPWWDILGGFRVPYNVPNGDNKYKWWNLAIPDNYEDKYYRNLEKNRGLNLPEVLSIALKSKGKEFIEQNKQLINRLGSLAGILKKPQKSADNILNCAV